MPFEPQARLLADPNLSAELQADLDAFASPEVVNYDAAAGLARFEAAIGVAPVAAAGAAEAAGLGVQSGIKTGIFPSTAANSPAASAVATSAVATGASKAGAGLVATEATTATATVTGAGLAGGAGLFAKLSTLKVAAALALGTAAIGGGLWAASSYGVFSSSGDIARHNPGPVIIPAPTPTVVNPPAPEAQAEPKNPETLAKTKVSPRKKLRKHGANKSLGPDPAREAIAVNRARRALSRGKAQRTLSILAQLKAKHPKGHLLPERQALKALALHELGRDKRAEKEAKSFLRSYPDSPLASRIRSLLLKSGSK